MYDFVKTLVLALGQAPCHKNLLYKKLKKQDAAHEPECSHVEHFCETSYLDSLVHFSLVTVPVHCRLWNAEVGGVPSMESGM